MTDLEKLKAKIAAAKFQPNKNSTEYAFQRGWNEALSMIGRLAVQIEKGET